MAPRSYTDSWVKKAKWLTQALIISGMLNVGLLCTFIYTAVKNSSRPLVEKVRAKQSLALADNPTLQQLLSTYSVLTFQQLLLRLANPDHVEAGYTRRDVALACLVHFHHFNLEKALGGGVTLEKREIPFMDREGRESLALAIYPGLADYQYQAIVQYAKTEKWPLTARGLFVEMQLTRPPYDPSLLEAFYLTPEFHYIYLLFSKTGIGLKKVHLATLLAQGSWSNINEMASHLRKSTSFTPVERRALLLRLISEGSVLAGKILLESDQAYCLKSLDNETVIALCDLLGERMGVSFLKSLLKSPRSDAVWKKAATLLYEQAAEEVPQPLELASARRRFLELKVDPAPSSPPAKRAVTTYTVAAGDSLWKIAREHGTTVRKLREVNHLESDRLKIGQTLALP